MHKVFVYGTLKPGGHYWPAYCEGKVSDAVPARIRGELYDLHVGYPGLLLGADSWVQGYVLTFPREADFLQLDVLEDYVPGRAEAENEYNRLKVEYFDAAGAPMGEVWAYAMTPKMVRHFKGTLIDGGAWR